MIISPHSLWDMAGVDGLQAAKALFGQEIDRIAPFQSIETMLANQPCSVLRLCELNFRIAWSGDPALFAQLAQVAQAGRQVWVRQFSWLGSIALTESIDRLGAIAIPKPPHRLHDLPRNCAAPARIDGIAVLIWRHLVSGQPAIELHTAAKDVEVIQAKIVAIAPQFASN